MPHEHLDRLRVILDTLGKGGNADAVDAALKVHNRQEGAAAFSRGEEAVIRVADAIEKIPAVRVVVLTELGSPEDLRSQDLIVEFTPRQPQEYDTVAVQVKSLSSRVKSFREELQRKFNFSPDEVDPWLQHQRLIVLSGDREEDEIRKSFIGQLNAIQAYHRNTLLE